MATLHNVAAQAATLDDTPDKVAVYLSLADNYEKLLEAPKVTTSLDSAAATLKAINHHNHAYYIIWSKWLWPNVPTAAGIILAYLLMLYNDLFKKATSYLTTRQLLRWWPNQEFARALGTTLPTGKLIIPTDVPSIAPALVAPNTDNEAAGAQAAK